MKKRWIILMIAGSLTCSVCGCGNRTQEEPGNTVTPIIVEDITGQDMNFPNAGGVKQIQTRLLLIPPFLFLI